MRTHSLYLSTLSGITPAAHLVAAIGGAKGTDLQVSAIISGKIEVGHLIVVNGVVNSIASFFSGTLGGVGVYLFTNPVGNYSGTNMFMTYSAPQVSSKYAPLYRNNLNQMKWNINWSEIFGNQTGECKVRVDFLSTTSSMLTWNVNVGSIRASFACSTSNNSNGMNIGDLRLNSEIAPSIYTAATYKYLTSENTINNGTSMKIPTTNGDFILTMLNSSELPMPNVPDYQIWLYFDVDDDE